MADRELEVKLLAGAFESLEVLAKNPQPAGFRLPAPAPEAARRQP